MFLVDIRRNNNGDIFTKRIDIKSVKYPSYGKKLLRMIPLFSDCNTMITFDNHSDIILFKLKFDVYLNDRAYIHNIYNNVSEAEILSLINKFDIVEKQLSAIVDIDDLCKKIQDVYIEKLFDSAILPYNEIIPLGEWIDGMNLKTKKKTLDEKKRDVIMELDNYFSKRIYE